MKPLMNGEINEGKGLVINSLQREVKSWILTDSEVISSEFNGHKSACSESDPVENILYCDERMDCSTPELWPEKGE